MRYIHESGRHSNFLMSVRTLIWTTALLAALPATTAEHWTLEVPTGIESATPEALKGVLVSWGTQVFQAIEFGLQETSDGKVALAWLNGYDQDGNGIAVTRELCGGGVALGQLALSQIRLASDSRGFLTVGSASQPTESEPPTYNCGMSTLQSCIARSCSALNCGVPPNCACTMPGGGGSCDILTRNWCDGACAPGVGQCNQMVVNCGCGVGASLPPVDPPGSTTAPKKPKAPGAPSPKPDIQPRGDN